MCEGCDSIPEPCCGEWESDHGGKSAPKEDEESDDEKTVEYVNKGDEGFVQFVATHRITDKE